jgi:sugar lactone lactonase YvrE
VFAVLAAVLALAAAPPRVAPVTAPFQAVVEPLGTLLVADGASGRIVRIDPRSGRRSLFAKGLGQAFGLALGPDGVYVSTETTVVRLAGGKWETVVRGLHHPIGLVVAKDGTIFVADSETNRVLRFDADTRKRTVIASTGLDQPLGLALRSDGALLVCDSHHGRVVRIGEHGTLENVLEGLSLPVAVTAAPGGVVYVSDHVEHGVTGTILRLHPSGKTDLVSVGKITSLSGVAVGRGGALYATAFSAPFIGRVDRSGALRPFPSS